MDEVFNGVLGKEGLECIIVVGLGFVAAGEGRYNDVDLAIGGEMWRQVMRLGVRERRGGHV